MTERSRWPCLLAALVLCGCVDTVRAAASSYRDTDVHVSATGPLCEPAGPEGGSPMERARLATLLDGCRQALLDEGMRLAGADEECDALNIVFTLEDSGDDHLRCNGFGGCQSRTIFRKTARAQVMVPGNTTPAVDLEAAMRSELRALTRDTAYALCAAMFRDYPEIRNNRNYSIDLPPD